MADATSEELLEMLRRGLIHARAKKETRRLEREAGAKLEPRICRYAKAREEAIEAFSRTRKSAWGKYVAYRDEHGDNEQELERYEAAVRAAAKARDEAFVAAEKARIRERDEAWAPYNAAERALKEVVASGPFFVNNVPD